MRVTYTFLVYLFHFVYKQNCSLHVYVLKINLDYCFHPVSISQQKKKKILIIYCPAVVGLLISAKHIRYDEPNKLVSK